MNEAMLNLKELKPPFKYMVGGMRKGYPNTPEDLKKGDRWKSCAAPSATFSHASNLKCMICRKEFLLKSTMKPLMINWIHVGQISLS